MSGCGDHDDDPRPMQCKAETRLDSCDNYIFHNKFPDLWPKKFVQREIFTHHMPYEVFARGVHVCFNLPIGLGDPISELRSLEYSLPPMEANHRDNWGRYGEYAFIPSARWLHNAEHGTAIFLYDGCLREEDLCKVRSYISRKPDDGAGPFRWVLSTYLHGQRAPHLQDTLMLHFRLFVTTYSSTLGVHCWDEGTIDWFLDRHYREAYEDLAMDGYYDYQFINGGRCGTKSRLQSGVAQAFAGAQHAVAAVPIAFAGVIALMIHHRKKTLATCL